MRWAHVCPEYSDDMFWYYPARKPYIIIFLVATLEFPYLLNVFSPDALLYARAFTSVTYPIFAFVLIERYFFYTRFSSRTLLFNMIVPILFLLPLAYFALKGEAIAIRYDFYIMTVAIVISFLEVATGMKLLLRLYKKANAEAEKEYSSSHDFPTVMAKDIIITTPLLIVFCVILPSLFQSGWIKMIRDVLLAVFNIWLTATTLVSHRPHKTDSEKSDASSEADASLDSQYSSLLDDILNAVITRQLYMDPSLKLDDLVLAVASNRSYVSKAISESRWQSFYRMMNSLRIARALELKEDYPNIKQDELAERSGFASRFMLNRWMKTWETGELTGVDDAIRERISQVIDDTQH
jgi:hypothetical protein